MAIFMASTKSISRGKGQSAVASASYRAGVELQDKRYGKTHDYSKRHGVISADIILPSSLKNENITIDRGELWNLAEKTEKRKDARTAREWLVNLPYELDEKTRKELAHQFSQALADRYGVIADCAIHKPTQKEIERGADARNFHAHIMLTTRKAELDQNGKILLTDKSTAELSDKKRRSLGLERMSHEVKEVRQLWETLANEKLLEHGHNLIDSRSYKEQGIDIMPQIKMGKQATHLERDGVQTIKGDINRAIMERNELVFNRELLENKRINDRADQIIIENRRVQAKEQMPSTKTSVDGSHLEPIQESKPTPEPKPAKSDAVAKAMALAKQVKAKREQEKIKQAKERAEQIRQQREEQKRQQEEERQRLLQQQRAEKAELERQEQAQEFINDLRQIASNALNDTERLITNKRLDKDSPAGKALLAVLAGKQVIDELDKYIEDDTKTDKQKQLADTKRNQMMEQTITNAGKALDEIKDLRYTSDRNKHLEPLQNALSSLNTHSKQHQQQLQAVERQVNDFRHSINRSIYGLGR